MFKRWWWVFLVSLIVLPVTGLLVSGVITYMMPKKYEATSIVQVQARAPDFGPGQVASSANFFPTEFEVITAAKTLELVIDDLELDLRWGMSLPEAQQALKAMVATHNIRGTDLIEIKVRATNSQDAQQIANSLTKAYASRRAGVEEAEIQAEVEVLRKALAEQEAAFQAAKEKLVEVSKDRGPTDPEFQAAKDTYDTEQAKIEPLKLEIVSRQRNGRMSPIIVHAEAIANNRPVTPSVGLNLGIGFVAGLLSVFVLPFLIILILQKIFPPKEKPTSA